MTGARRVLLALLVGAGSSLAPATLHAQERAFTVNLARAREEASRQRAEVEAALRDVAGSWRRIAPGPGTLVVHRRGGALLVSLEADGGAADGAGSLEAGLLRYELSAAGGLTGALQGRERPAPVRGQLRLCAAGLRLEGEAGTFEREDGRRLVARREDLAAAAAALAPPGDALALRVVPELAVVVVPANRRPPAPGPFNPARLRVRALLVVPEGFGDASVPMQAGLVLTLEAEDGRELARVETPGDGSHPSPLPAGAARGYQVELPLPPDDGIYRVRARLLAWGQPLEADAQVEVRATFPSGASLPVVGAAELEQLERFAPVLRLSSPGRTGVDLRLLGHDLTDYAPIAVEAALRGAHLERVVHGLTVMRAPNPFLEGGDWAALEVGLRPRAPGRGRPLRDRARRAGDGGRDRPGRVREAARPRAPAAHAPGGSAPRRGRRSPRAGAARSRWAHVRGRARPSGRALAFP